MNQQVKQTASWVVSLTGALYLTLSCSRGDNSGGAQTTPLAVASTTAYFAPLQALSPTARSALHAQMASLSFDQLYAGIAATASNTPIAIDGVEIPSTLAVMASSKPLFDAGQIQYGSLERYWSSPSLSLAGASSSSAQQAGTITAVYNGDCKDDHPEYSELYDFAVDVMAACMTEAQATGSCIKVPSASNPSQNGQLAVKNNPAGVMSLYYQSNSGTVIKRYKPLQQSQNYTRDCYQMTGG